MIKNLIYSGGTFVAKMVLQLGIFALFAHLYDESKFALISLAFSLSWAITNISDYGYRTKLVKDYVISKDKSGTFLNQLLQTSDSIKLIIFFVLFGGALIYLLLANLQNDFLFFVIYLLAALLLSLANGRFAILQAKENFNDEFIINLSSVGLYVLSTCIVIYFSEQIIYIAITYLFYALCVYLIASKKLKYRLKFNFKGLREEFIVASPYATMVIINVALITLDILLVKAYGTLNDLAFYQVFTRINVGMLIVFNVFYTVALPIISKFICDNNWQEINKLHFILFAIAIVMITTFLINDSYWLRLIFSEKYTNLTQYSWVIAGIALIKYGYWFTAELILISTGNQSNRAKGYTLGALVSLIIYFFAIKYFSWRGLVIANLISVLIIAIIYYYFVASLWKKSFNIYRTIELLLLLLFIGGILFVKLV